MLNQTNMAKSSKPQKRAFFIASSKITDSQVEIPSKYNIETANNYHRNYVVGYIQRLSLGTQAAIVAIAIASLPTLGIGAIAYGLAQKSTTKQIKQSHTATATRLTDQINRLMLGRYEDIQIISKSPFFTNPTTNTNTSDKQAFLNSFVNTRKAYNSIAIFDTAQKLIVQSTGAPLNNIKDTQEFAEILQKDTPVISQPEKSVLNITAPIKNAVTGQTIAVVSANMPVQSLADVTQ